MNAYKGKAADILKSAKKLFSEKGYKAVTTREIASLSSVNEVTIFRHFKNKERLFKEMLKWSLLHSNTVDLSHIPQNHPREWLLEIARIIQSVFIVNLDILRIEIMERNLTEGNLIQRFPKQLNNYLIKQLSENYRMTKEDSELFSVTFLCSVHGLCMNFYFLHSLETDSGFESALQFLIDPFAKRISHNRGSTK